MSLTRRPQRPRVAHVTTSHAASDVRIFERECRSLAESGRYDVTIVAAGGLPAGSNVRTSPLPPRPTARAGRFTRGPYYAWKFARVHDFDIWHFHDPEALPVAIWLAGLGKTVIWDAHEDYVAQVSSDGAKNWVPRPLQGMARGLLRHLLDTADKVVAGVIGATETIAGRYTNPRTVVVGNEARLSDFAGCTPTFLSRQVLFTGSPTEGHCFPQVIAALEGLPGVTLAVAGRPPDNATWTDAQRRLRGRARHLGWLNRAELATAISQSAVGLVTYSPTPTYLDPGGSPTKLFEFTAAGLPVVVTPNPACHSIVAASNSGVVAEGYAPGDIGQAIEALLDDRGVWQQRSSDARSWARANGSWDASERRLLDLYDDLTAAI